MTRTALTHGDVARSAHAVAGALRAGGLRQGDRALLLLPEGGDFIPAFLGCLRAGVVAVPAYPPVPVQSRQRVATLRSIAADCEPAAAISFVPPKTLGTVREAVPELANAWWTSVPELLATEDPGETLPAPSPDDIAFLQYTSGSTALPKGVVVPHRALAHNEEMIREAFRHTEGVTVVGWLPLFHDMGLIGNVLQPLWLGGHSVLMPPMTFIKRPGRWLRAISEFRATTSGAPNFAYDLCLRKVTDDELAGVDLSCWTLAYNGAEPVRASTLDSFAKRFAPWGFSATASYPCYGLAEGTLLVTGGEVTERPSTVTLDEERLRAGQAVRSTAGRSLVSSGSPRLDRTVTIVDAETRIPVPSGTVGEIWLGGPGLPTGYWGNPRATEEIFTAGAADGTGPYLRTGDLGFLLDGELYVTGRAKDLIIVGGRNHYPHDLESTAERAHPALRTGCVVAFGVETGEAEQVVLIAGAGQGATGTGEAAAGKRAEIVHAVRSAVSATHGIAVDDVVLVAPNAVPKTSSGKLQRGRCRAAYLRGEYRSVSPGGSS